MNNHLNPRAQLVSDLATAEDFARILELATHASSDSPQEMWWRNPVAKHLAKHPPQTIAELTSVLDILPDHVPSLVSRAALYEEVDYSLAAEDWKAVDRLRPHEPRALRSLLQLAEANDDLAELDRLTEAASQRFPNDRWWHAARGPSLERTRPSEAESFYRTTINRTNPTPLQALVRIHRKKGEWQQVLDVCDEAATKFPTQRWWRDARNSARTKLGLDPLVETRFELSQVGGSSHFVKHSGDAAAKERSIYRYLGGKGLPIPLCVASPNPDTLTLEFVEGANIDQVRTRCGEAGLATALATLGRFAQQLHGVSIGGGFGRIENMEDLPSKTSSQQVSEVLLNLTRRLALIEHHAFRKRVQSSSARFAAALNYDGAPRLCHGDLHPWNALFHVVDNQPTLASVFDFESALSADPMLDLGRMLAYLDHADLGDYASHVLAEYGIAHGTEEHRRAEIHRALYSVGLFTSAVYSERDDLAEKTLPLVVLALDKAESIAA